MKLDDGSVRLKPTQFMDNPQTSPTSVILPPLLLLDLFRQVVEMNLDEAGSVPIYQQPDQGQGKSLEPGTVRGGPDT